METGKKIFYRSPDTGKESGNISPPLIMNCLSLLNYEKKKSTARPCRQKHGYESLIITLGLTTEYSVVAPNFKNDKISGL